MQKANIKICDLTKELVPQVYDIETQCFSKPWSLDAFYNEIEMVSSKFLVACENEEVVGYVNGRLVLDEFYINNIAVRNDKRGNGIGFEIINSLEKDKDIVDRIKFMTLEVRVSNKIAQKLYQKCGFNIVGRRKDFYVKPIEDAFLMTKYLNK